MMALAVEAVVAEAVAALGRSSGHEATHHAPSEQGLSQTLLQELLTLLSALTLLSEQPPPPERSSADQNDQTAETQRAELSQRGVHVLTLRGPGGDLLAFAAFYERENYHGTDCKIVWLQELCVLTARRRTKLGTGLVVAAQPRVQ